MVDSIEPRTATSPQVPLVSVIIPTRNRGSLIGRAIRSVLAQSLSAWELIIVDDASIDNTMDMVKSFSDDRILYLKMERRVGAAAARNSGIRLARGQYVAFLDSDDEWMSNKLQMQLQIFDKAPPSTGLVYCGVVKRSRAHDKKTHAKMRGNLHRQSLIKNIIGTPSTVLIRREVLTADLMFDERLPARQDTDLWVRITAKYEVDCCAEPLVVKHHDAPDRIGKNRVARRRGLLRFFRKHEQELVAAHRAAACLYLLKTGRKFEMRPRKPRIARWCYRKAISLQPTRIAPYHYFLRSYVFQSRFPVQRNNLLRSVEALSPRPRR